jgi:hypothetical protein
VNQIESFTDRSQQMINVSIRRGEIHATHPVTTEVHLSFEQSTL